MNPSLPPPDADPGPPALRLRTPADIAEAVPYLLGFHPTDSVVLLCLRGPTRRVAYALRSGLPSPGEERRFASAMARRMIRDGATATVLAFYPPPGPVRYDVRSQRPLARTLEAELDRSRIPVVEAITVADGRWWSVRCTDPGCCPARGRPLAPADSGNVSVVRAAATVAGLAALPDRQSLVDSLRPPEAPVAAQVRRAFQRARVDHRDRERALGLLRDAAAWTCGPAAWRPGPARPGQSPDRVLDHDRMAILVLLLHDPAVRARAMDWAGSPAGEGAHALWGELARRSVPPYQGVPLALLAWTAWQRGDGALARVAVERARQADPGLELAELIELGLDLGLPHPGAPAVGLGFTAGDVTGGRER